MGLEICARCSKQRYATGQPGKVQGREGVGLYKGPVGIGL